MKTPNSSRYHFRYEFISLLRQRWLQFLGFTLLLLVVFSLYNGKQKVDLRMGTINEAIATVKEKDSLGVILLDSIEAGHTVSVPRWYMPNKPNVMGYNYPRVAAMPADNMAMIATGQSDIYSHYVKPTMYGESFELNFTELSNPVQLMFGSFDLSFVLIYLLPLIVIAFAYNILSQEREQGILSLVASHPISLYNWLLQKAFLRYIILAGILIVLLLVTLPSVGVSLFADIGKTSTLLLLTLGYLLFWFLLAFLINLRGKSSANNAVTLIAWWIALVLLLPSSINQTANSLFPVPSRARLVNELRVVNVEAEKKADELLASFLRDHPELAGHEGGSQGWKEYFASQDLIRKEIQPVLDEYEVSLQRQQAWVDNLRFISPALLLQGALNEVSGTSTKHYKNYRQQVSDFSIAWRDFFMPLVFRGEDFTKAMMADLPGFTYQPPAGNSTSTANMIAIMVYCGLLLGGGLVWSRKRSSRALMPA